MEGAGDPFGILKELEKTRIQRELAIVQILEKRQLAYRFAEHREKIKWHASGGLVTSILCVLSSYHNKNLIHLLPVLPIATHLGYSSHYCYGNKAEILHKKTIECLENIEKTALSSITVEDVRKCVAQARALEKAENELFSLLD